MANYYLKSINSDKEQLIYLRTKIRGQEFKYSLGTTMKVLPANWDNEKRCFTPEVVNFKEKNGFLKKFNTKFESLCDDMMAKKRHICTETLRESLDEVIRRIRVKPKTLADKTFEEHWEDWKKYLLQIRDIETVKKKGYTLTSIKKFSAQTGYKLSFDSINRTFATNYKDWAFSLTNGKGEYVYSTDNTINKYLSIVKEFMKWCTEEGRNTNMDYRMIKDLEGEYFDVFALSKDDINRLMKIDFNSLSEEELKNCKSTSEKLELVRDGFVFRALCGIRFSDFRNMTKSNFDENKLRLITKKTGNPLYFELHPIAHKILIKYNFKIPTFYNGKDNFVLKDIGKIAGFFEDFRTTKRRKGQLIYEDKKRWEILTTHVARKTFITTCLNAGIQQHVVMTLAGILKPATLLRYIQVTNKDIEREVRKLHEYIN